MQIREGSDEVLYIRICIHMCVCVCVLHAYMCIHADSRKIRCSPVYTNVCVCLCYINAYAHMQIGERSDKFCIYVNRYTCICSNSNIYPVTRICIHVNTHNCMYNYIHINVYFHIIHAYTGNQMYNFIYGLVCTYKRIYVHKSLMYIHTCIHTYIHTYTYIFT